MSKICAVTGVTEKEGIAIMRPTSRILVVVRGGEVPVADFGELSARVTLQNSETGESREICPKTLLPMLSEIGSHGEGFSTFCKYEFLDASGNVQANGWDSATKKIRYKGDTRLFIVLNTEASVQLGNNKYIQLDLFGLQPTLTTEIFAIEKPDLSDFSILYQRFNMAGGEFEKRFDLKDIEAVALPIEDLKEVQLYGRDSSIAPVYTIDELKHLMETSNDICSVNSYPNPSISGSVAGESVSFGFEYQIVLDVRRFKSMEVRRNKAVGVFNFLTIDNVK